MSWTGETRSSLTIITDDKVSGFRAAVGEARNPVMITFLSLWLAGWAIGELAVLSWFIVVPLLLIGWVFGLVPTDMLYHLGRYARGKWGEILFIFCVWFPFWTFAGMVVYRAWRWQVGGREVIVIHKSIMELRRENGLKQDSRTFDLQSVRNLRFDPNSMIPDFALSPEKASRSMQVMLRSKGGTIAFDYNGLTHRFGIGLSEIEANRLISEILRHGS